MMDMHGEVLGCGRVVELAQEKSAARSTDGERLSMIATTCMFCPSQTEDPTTQSFRDRRQARHNVVLGE